MKLTFLKAGIDHRQQPVALVPTNDLSKAGCPRLYCAVSNEFGNKHQQPPVHEVLKQPAHCVTHPAPLTSTMPIIMAMSTLNVEIQSAVGGKYIPPIGWRRASTFSGDIAIIIGTAPSKKLAATPYFVCARQRPKSPRTKPVDPVWLKRHRAMVSISFFGL